LKTTAGGTSGSAADDRSKEQEGPVPKKQVLALKRKPRPNMPKEEPEEETVTSS
jgi:hypothetical protein